MVWIWLDTMSSPVPGPGTKKAGCTRRRGVRSGQESRLCHEYVHGGAAPCPGAYRGIIRPYKGKAAHLAALDGREPVHPH